MFFDEQILQQITVDVCQSMLSLELIPLEHETDTACQLVASVEIRGTRKSKVEVFADEHLMGSIAEVMFQSDRGSLSETEVRDAFCEIANMIGGNVKGCFGEEADLTLPEFGQAADSCDHHSVESIRTAFLCCGKPLTIVLRELNGSVEPVAACR
jgi:CheY-specific phosphatase CheX